VSDPRPGFEEVSARRGRLAGWGWPAAIGVVMGLLIFLGPDDDRAHMLGRTSRTDTTVVSAELESGCDAGQRAVYRLGWLDASGVGHVSTFRRCGPVRHQVGDHVRMWVSPDRDKAWEEGPQELWAWALVGVPSLGLLAAGLHEWRRRVILRQLARGQERREGRRSRAAGG
jgi:hypothetical protein